MMRCLGQVWLVWLVLVGDARAECDVDIVGARLIDAQVCLQLTGEPPMDASRLQAWAGPAIDNLLGLYRERGFIAARAWAKIRDDTVTIEIDEGVIHRVRVLGSSTIESLRLSDNLDLADGNVLFEPDLAASLERIREQSGARSVSWSLSDGDEVYANAFGVFVRERVLDVHLLRDEDVGFDVDVDVEPLWGFVTSLIYEARRQQIGDHLSTSLTLATPYRQWVTEQDATLRWVYGAAGIRYRAPTLGSSSVAPLFALESSLGQYQRIDIDVRSGLVQHVRANAGIGFGTGRALHFQLGLAGEYAHVHRLLRGIVDPDVSPSVTSTTGDFSPLETDPLFRVFLSSGLNWLPDDGTLRRDLRDEVRLSSDIGVASDGGVALRLDGFARVVKEVRRSDALASFQGAWRGGDLRFFDEVPIGSHLQRVYFQDRFWTTALAQAEVAYRQHFVRDVKFGVYHDLSVFSDRFQPEQARLANAFGPSLHVLILDQFAFETAFGVGFAPSGRSTNITLRFRSVY